jgi:hypothetical protein
VADVLRMSLDRSNCSSSTSLSLIMAGADPGYAVDARYLTAILAKMLA